MTKDLPAFPIPMQPGDVYNGHSKCDGLTMRDYFAAKALIALRNHSNTEYLAKRAYEIADAMMKARES